MYIKLKRNATRNSEHSFVRVCEGVGGRDRRGDSLIQTVCGKGIGEGDGEGDSLISHCIEKSSQ